MATPAQAVDVVVAQMRGERSQFLVLSEEAFAVVSAVIGREGLKLSIDGMSKRAQQRAGAIACEKTVPIRTPDEYANEYIDGTIHRKIRIKSIHLM